MKIFLLDKHSSIIDVKNNILKRTYQEELLIAKQDVKQAQVMSEEEKYFYYEWDNERTKTEDIILSETEDNIIETRVLETYAELEFPKKRKKDPLGNILPKKDRINDTSIRVIFFENEKAIYFLIFTSNESHIDRVRKLIGENYIKDVDQRYHMAPDLFNWLFYKYSVSKGCLTEELTLNNISGFIGNSIDEHNIFKSSSDQTSDLIITKAFISNGEILKNITARITSPEGELVFSLDHNSNSTLFLNQSIMYFNSSDKEMLTPIYLFKLLIPAIKNAYEDNSKKFLEKDKKQFSAKIGLEVIQSIIENNDIELKEIKGLFSIPQKDLPSVIKN